MSKCKICGKELQNRQRCYCSKQCAAIAAGKRRLVKERKPYPPTTIYYERICPDCGRTVMMHIKSKRCPECQAEENRRANAAHRSAKAAGYTRIIGNMYPCERCGEMYVLEGGRQKYCKRCAPLATKENIRESARERAANVLADPECREQRNTKRRNGWQNEKRVCAECGMEYIPTYAGQRTCSEICRAKRKSKQQHASEIKRQQQRKKEKEHDQKNGNTGICAGTDETQRV